MNDKYGLTGGGQRVSAREREVIAERSEKSVGPRYEKREAPMAIDEAPIKGCSEIERQYNALNDALTLLHAAILKLEAGLAPILNTAQTESKTESKIDETARKALPESASVMAHALERATTKTSHAVSAVNYILSRVEI